MPSLVCFIFLFPYQRIHRRINCLHSSSHSYTKDARVNQSYRILIPERILAQVYGLWKNKQKQLIGFIIQYFIFKKKKKMGIPFKQLLIFCFLFSLLGRSSKTIIKSKQRHWFNRRLCGHRFKDMHTSSHLSLDSSLRSHQDQKQPSGTLKPERNFSSKDAFHLCFKRFFS